MLFHECDSPDATSDFDRLLSRHRLAQTASLGDRYCIYMYAHRAYEADVDMLFGIAICSSRRSRQRLAEY